MVGNLTIRYGADQDPNVALRDDLVEEARQIAARFSLPWNHTFHNRVRISLTSLFSIFFKSRINPVYCESTSRALHHTIMWEFVFKRIDWT
jgi:hypothetical protein